MTSKEMFGKLDRATIGRNTSRLKNFRQALAANNLAPAYREPVTAETAAWGIILLSTCPTSNYTKAVDWVERKKKFFEAMEGSGEYSPVFMLTEILDNEQAAGSVVQIMIEKATGLLIVHTNNPEKPVIKSAPITDSEIPFSEYTFRDVSMIEGSLIRDLAQAIAAAKVDEVVKQN